MNKSIMGKFDHVVDSSKITLGEWEGGDVGMTAWCLV
jgi:hypothetical protein